jgi:hypothetical protein
MRTSEKVGTVRLPLKETTGADRRLDEIESCGFWRVSNGGPFAVPKRVYKDCLHVKDLRYSEWNYAAMPTRV